MTGDLPPGPSLDPLAQTVALHRHPRGDEVFVRMVLRGTTLVPRRSTVVRSG